MLELSVSCAGLSDQVIVDMFAVRSTEGMKRFSLVKRDCSFCEDTLALLKDVLKSKERTENLYALVSVTRRYNLYLFYASISMRLYQQLHVPTKTNTVNSQHT